MKIPQSPMFKTLLKIKHMLEYIDERNHPVAACEILDHSQDLMGDTRATICYIKSVASKAGLLNGELIKFAPNHYKYSLTAAGSRFLKLATRENLFVAWRETVKEEGSADQSESAEQDSKSVYTQIVVD